MTAAILSAIAPHDPEYRRRAWFQDRDFLDRCFQKIPGKFRAGGVAEFVRRYVEQGRAAANAAILEISDRFSRRALPVASSDAELRAAAARYAAACGRLQTLEARRAYAEARGIEPPPADLYSEEGQAARLACERWWRRALRRSVVRAIEAAARDLGYVHRRAGLYCSDEAMRRRQQQQARNRATIEQMQACNLDTGEVLDLLEIMDGSISNPAVRRAEMMVRMRGFEEWARDLGLVARFYTITCPSRMHARHADGEPNPKYDGTTPRAAQRYLARQWSRIRSALDRRGIRLMGFRVAEPHHDGTPHWHMLFFMEPWAAGIVARIIRAYALQEDGSEPGAWKHRFQEEIIDTTGGKSATGYLAKYIAKNIDGHEVGADFEAEGADARDTAPRVDAWASTWGIRQFQQIGGPPVGVWRELRRLADAPPGHLGRLYAAADAGDWGLFCRYWSAGPAGLIREITGETNDYGEPRAPRVVGVMAAGIEAVTRPHRWILELKPAAGGPWTCVNNCTGEPENAGTHARGGPPDGRSPAPPGDDPGGIGGRWGAVVGDDVRGGGRVGGG